MPLGGNTIADGTPANEGLVLQDASSVAEQALACIVSISCRTVNETQHLVDGKYETHSEETTGDGTGVIIGDNNKEIWIVTNRHIVKNATTMTVKLVNGEQVDAHMKGYDKEHDIAVIAIKMKDLTDDAKQAIRVMPIDDSGNIKIGQGVIAIGNMLGNGIAVTTGIVSALDRSVPVEDKVYNGLIQIDAAINPGNSGGALINTSGKLIGIPSVKQVGVDTEGMGYAIPITDVKSTIEELCAKPIKVMPSGAEKARIGIEVTNSYLGVLVFGITQDGPAAKAGLCLGDYVLEINGVTLETFTDLTAELKYYEPGDTIQLKIKHPNKLDYTEYYVNVKLDAMPTS